jgi:hypothetical protein
MSRTKTSAAASPIIAAAGGLLELSRRLADTTEAGSAEDKRRFDVAFGEWERTKANILELRPACLADAAIQLMIAYDAATSALACCVATGDAEEAGDYLDRLAAALARILRFTADAAGIDLAKFAGADFFIDKNDEFPEFSDAAAEAEAEAEA